MQHLQLFIILIAFQWVLGNHFQRKQIIINPIPFIKKFIIFFYLIQLNRFYYTYCINTFII
jgi:hypothetical protein